MGRNAGNLLGWISRDIIQIYGHSLQQFLRRGKNIVHLRYLHDVKIIIVAGMPDRFRTSDPFSHIPRKYTGIHIILIKISQRILMSTIRLPVHGMNRIHGMKDGVICTIVGILIHLHVIQEFRGTQILPGRFQSILCDIPGRSLIILRQHTMSPPPGEHWRRKDRHLPIF